MRVLSVASEAFPLLKTGGLADVVGALPAALTGQDVEMRVLLPGFPAIVSKLENAEPLHRYKDLFGSPARVLAGTAGGLAVLVVDAPKFYDRPGNPYVDENGVDWLDNWKRFAALCRVAADVGLGRFPAFRPDVVHCHDWHSGLTPAYLHYAGETTPGSVMTIHNIAFQGRFDSAIFPELGLPDSAFSIDGVEYFGGAGYLKAGLQFADAITTVSPTYAEEICQPAGGMGLDGLLRSRQAVVSGIVNGIDTDVWNPATDHHLARTYTATRLSARAANKRKLEEVFGLEKGDGILFGVVSRLSWQKGMDILGETLDSLVAAGARFAILGSGDVALEAMFRAAEARHSGRIGLVIGYDEALSHLIQGGGDAILVPSRFEPCGLTQFYGLRYGCVPVVSRVGGLADTVIDANMAGLAANVATGIQFLPVEPEALAGALLKAVALYDDRKLWQRLQKNGMKTDVTWAASAARYAELYAAVKRG